MQKFKKKLIDIGGRKWCATNRTGVHALTKTFNFFFTRVVVIT
jgi:hypothetical protein